MNTQVAYNVQTCNGNPEVIKLINGRADEVIKDFDTEHEAMHYSDVLNAHHKSIEQFKEFADGQIGEDKYTFQNTYNGFIITRNDRNYISKWEIDLIDAFCGATHRFTWHVVSIPNIKERCSFEILCYY